MKKHVCLHGHFYQPPRENPWTGEVGPEESAKPYHDWNERITKECYEANTQAPVLDSRGQVLWRVNNFENISFDIGPTLLSWLKRRAPSTYQAILAADRESLSKRNGHGNALAQVYNHVIMPLCDKRDKITQILWGIRDFEFHFRRKPEGMWLSEAAVDRQTLDLMADQGILFTVLAPHQASRVRHLGFGTRWAPVVHESIDARTPYRVILSGGRHFHLFFYNAPISRAIAFEGLLWNGDKLNDRILAAFGRRDREQLVSTATDGESFGHHHRFGEMAIAYALPRLEEQRLARLTNFGDFLERCGSFWETDIHENSSWSCAHGVERWRSDCGCRISHAAGWNQKWRAVLREAFDGVKEAVDRVFEREGARLMKDPWAARNEYVDVILNPSDEARKRFLSRHARRNPGAADEKKWWGLLEAERYRLLMYTSCAWFFDDLSGIESVQMMRYAWRAMELAQPHASEPMEAAFLKIMREAKSNFPKQGTGENIFNKYVKTAK
ncbi:MAG: DUF3536 domain-containing protein [Candidatus Omnitrophica bacterium]|nr:DUF3536 domain-containing protein [Candidatus Omnitrophota bacterium]